MKLRHALTTLAILISGCAATPLAGRDATLISTLNQIAFTQPSKDTAPVMVIRDSGSMGAACYTKISANGLFAALITSGQKVLLHVPAGSVTIGAEASGQCGAGLIEQQANAVAGRPLYFRISYVSNFEFSLQPAPQ